MSKNGLDITIQRINALKNDWYDMEEGEHPPSESAINRAISFLKNTDEMLDRFFPAGGSSTSGRGDVRVYWMDSGRNVSFIIPEDILGFAHLYENMKGKSFFSDNASPRILANSLRRFLGE